ncbi:DUF6265 family protein [Rheinheimera sp. F8]|uniref:DUF6265 family protein n=1 Tax=Rheinheimera sp. F8 TaxID=1763998 RepID=UPI0007449432|nr:DUF6265 family protein [Rheinheimera sp. F8]ALZ75133.1 hypothetical protein ATY27_04760 [Rheinheimera sp. F8]ALZ76442.1 hypothetical protein ATY27_12185 [Rheinheimera sp. F8]
MLRLVLIPFSLLLSQPCQAECSPATVLAGHWQSDANQKGSYWQEQWSKLDVNNWQGQGRTVNQAGAETGREELRLLRMSGQWFYLAKVSHNPLPVAFALTECSASRLQFDNPAHDFPKRLVYQADNDRLSVDVSDGAGKGFQLKFKRQTSQ